VGELDHVAAHGQRVDPVASLLVGLRAERHDRLGIESSERDRRALHGTRTNGVLGILDDAFEPTRGPGTLRHQRRHAPEHGDERSAGAQRDSRQR
jgi:hypothetical protein